MRVTEARLKTARERLIGQQCVEIHRRLGDAHAMTLGRDRGMKIGQRLGVIEPAAFRHEALDELQDAIGAIDEAAQRFMRVDALVGLALIEPAFCARSVFGGRQIREGQEVARLEV